MAGMGHCVTDCPSDDFVPIREKYRACASANKADHNNFMKICKGLCGLAAIASPGVFW
jgi:hypothetical protein